jgi:hypothetical protein
LVALSSSSAPPKPDQEKEQATEKLFDADPNHPWNRLHQFFYIRSVPKGGSYVYRGPDAPLGRHGPFLVESNSHEEALGLLDDFLKAKDDERIEDPLKRALLQRDLWYVFDKLAEAPYFGMSRDDAEDKQPQRRAIQKRLAQVMRRLEQPATRLKTLPDTYALTVKSGAFAMTFDANHSERAYLPADLRLDDKSDWVIVRASSRSLSAPAHHRFDEGKAVFLTLLRLPGPRKKTEDYVADMPVDGEKKLRPLPDGTQVALVRRLLLPDDKGELRATPVTESVQLRIIPTRGEQQVFEFTLDRAGLLSGRGGLRAVDDKEVDYFGFHASAVGGVAWDPFAAGMPPKPRPVLSSCRGCHRLDAGVFSLNTFGLGMTQGYQGAARTSWTEQADGTVKLKKQSYSWRLLQGLRETTP